MAEEQNILKKNTLQQYIYILKDWIPANSSIAIAADNTYIYFHSGHHNIHLEVGQQVHPGSIAEKVLNTRKRTDAILENSLFETPYYGIGYPISIESTEAALVIVLPSSFSQPKLETIQFLTGKQDEDWSPIPIESISHIESLQKKTWFYRNGEQFKTNITLKDLQIRLPSTFIRIHRSYIINILFVKKITRDLASNFIITLKSGTQLPVSQSYMNDLRKVLEF